MSPIINVIPVDTGTHKAIPVPPVIPTPGTPDTPAHIRTGVTPTQPYESGSYMGDYGGAVRQSPDSAETGGYAHGFTEFSIGGSTVDDPHPTTITMPVRWQAGDYVFVGILSCYDLPSLNITINGVDVTSQYIHTDSVNLGAGGGVMPTGSHDVYPGNTFLPGPDGVWLSRDFYVIVLEFLGTTAHTGDFVIVAPTGGSLQAWQILDGDGHLIGMRPDTGGGAAIMAGYVAYTHSVPEQVGGIGPLVHVMQRVNGAKELDGDVTDLTIKPVVFPTITPAIPDRTILTIRGCVSMYGFAGAGLYGDIGGPSNFGVPLEVESNGAFYFSSYNRFQDMVVDLSFLESHGAECRHAGAYPCYAVTFAREITGTPGTPGVPDIPPRLVAKVMAVSVVTVATNDTTIVDTGRHTSVPRVA